MEYIRSTYSSSFLRLIKRLEPTQSTKGQDSPAMTAMLDAYLNKTSGADYKTAVALECRKQLEAIVKAGEAVKYAVAIKDKDFLWDVLYDKIYDHVKRMEVNRDAE